MTTSPLPDPNAGFYQQHPIILGGMCIFGEARGEDLIGKMAVAHVINNRSARNCHQFGLGGWPGVILKPYQFSSFNSNDPNRAKLLQPLLHEKAAVWEECYLASSLVYEGKVPDNTKGALFYFSPPLTEAPHAWGAVIPSASIGNLHFFRFADGI